MHLVFNLPKYQSLNLMAKIKEAKKGLQANVIALIPCENKGRFAIRRLIEYLLA